MKKLTILALCLLGGIVVSCYDDAALQDSINSLDKRVRDLEAWQRNAESNISTLFRLVDGLEKKVTVSSVKANAEGGYDILFSDGTKVSIKDGAPGSTPVIGVKKDSDGVYYWTLNGTWLLNDSGEKMRVTGRDGAPGNAPVIGVKKDSDGVYYWTLDGQWLLNAEGQKMRVTGENGAPGTPGSTPAVGVRQDSDGIYYWTINGEWLLNADGQKMRVTGENGAPGTPGSTPVVGVRQDSDGVYYWTLNGEWLLNADGEKMRVTGNDGAPGTPGSTPIVGIRQDSDGVYYWTLNGEWLLNADGEKMRVSGEDGAPGSPGSTPVIGVQEDVDGIYYWTINGEWLLNADGEKMRVTGADGEPGGSGGDGAPGITPQLKIEDGYWFVSTDEGLTWTQLGKATGDPGDPGDSLFKEVSYDDCYVYLVLQDNTVLKFSRGAASVQTISAIPNLKDGVGLNNGMTRIRFEVLPAAAAENLAALPIESFTLNLAYAHTKALAGDVVKLPVVSAEVSKGWLVVTVDAGAMDEKLLSGELSANASLNIYDGANYITTGYFPVYYDKDYVRKSISKQWRYDRWKGTTDDGVDIYETWLYDFGASYDGIYMDWNSTDQESWYRYSYEVQVLPGGLIKVYSPQVNWFRMFRNVTDTTAEMALYYTYDPGDYYNYEEDEYGWHSSGVTVTVNEPFQQLYWEQWCLKIGDELFSLGGSDYNGYDHFEHFVNDILENKEKTLPMVRMNNAGTAADFAKVDVTGKIAVVDRGDIPFWQKLQNASEAGAIAILCANNMDGGYMLADLSALPSSVKKIPYLAISKEAGEKLNGKTSASFTCLKDPRLYRER